MSKLPISSGLVSNRNTEVITPQDEKEILKTIRETNFTQRVRIEDGDLVRVMANGMTAKENKIHKQIVKQWQQ